MGTQPVFVSHASKDKPLADALVDLLTTGTNLCAKDVLCTSLEGMGVPRGSNFVEFLRDHIKDASVVLLLLTKNYFESVFCVCELGATWALKQDVFPLLVPPLTSAHVRDVLEGASLARIDAPGDLDELKDQIEKSVALERIATARWDAKKKTFLAKLEQVVGELPEPERVAAKELALASIAEGPSWNHLVSGLHHTLSDVAPPRGLSGRCAERDLRGFVERTASWRAGLLECDGQRNVLEMGKFILRNLTSGGFVTFYFPSERSWRSPDLSLSEEYLSVTREVARQGKEIVRVFVLRSQDDLAADTFLGLVAEDARAGITPLYVFEHEIPDEAARDFGIWDDELVAEVMFGRAGDASPSISKCHYYWDKYHLENARRWRDQLLRIARPCKGLPAEEALIAGSYEIQRQEALARCRGGRVGEDCVWYHGSWQYLRRADAVSTPSWHGDFYSQWFRQWACDHPGEERILVCGLADYGMLYHLVAGVGLADLGRCTFHVMDLCEVPLRMCEWLAGQLRRSAASVELALEASCEDVLDSAVPPRTYGLVASDAFLSRFESDDCKRQVLQEWVRLLKPDGWIVTTCRLRGSNDPLPPTDSAREAFVEKVASAAGTGVDVDVARTLAEDYAARMTSFPFRSRHHAAEFFESCEGLSVRELGFGGTPGEFGRSVYARVVLEQRSVREDKACLA